MGLNATAQSIDVGAAILKEQWWILLIALLIVPFIITLIMSGMIEKRMSLNSVRGKFWISFILTFLLSLITYLVCMSVDFGFIKNII